MADSNPLVELEANGQAQILSYDVPEPTAYPGRNFIDLNIDKTWFEGHASDTPPAASDTESSEQVWGMKEDFREFLTHGTISQKLKDWRQMAYQSPAGSGDSPPLAGPMPGTVSDPRDDSTSSSQATIESLRKLKDAHSFNEDEIELMSMYVSENIRLNTYQSLWGSMHHNYVPTPKAAEPSILLVESYRLSTFGGAYGAGRTIKTMSLLPGEKTKISMRTFNRSETTRKEASSILDSFTEESATEFEKMVTNESSTKDAQDKSFNYHAEAEARAGWGWGSAKVSGGVSGSTNATREEFAKNVASATEKQANKSSAKRDVQVDTSYEVRETTEEETAIVREIQNINASRTLNFTFRQMNQEFITILHLVDVRVAFFNGFPESVVEVPLHELDWLLEQVIVAGKRGDVQMQVMDAVTSIHDWQGDHAAGFVQPKTYMEGSTARTFQAVDRSYVSTFDDSELTGRMIDVPGVILSVARNVMRTEGVIVESLLGQSSALDSYSENLQLLAVEERELANQRARLLNQREQLAQTIVERGDETLAKLFEQLFETEAEPEAQAEDAGR